MANSFTTVGQIQQVNGENSNTWGDDTDTNWDINNLLVGGRLSQAITSGDVTPADVNGTADAGKNTIINTTGVLTGNRSLILPTKARRYTVSNNCTGAFTMTVKTVAGTGVVVPQGTTMSLICDATNIIEAVTAIVGSLTLVTALPLASGGLGAATAAGGRTTLQLSSADAVTFTSVTAYRPIVSVSGTTKTLTLSDANTRQECSNASAQTVTIPPNSSVAYPVGTEIEFVQIGAGKVTFAAGVGVTISSISSYKSLAAQFAGASFYQQSINTWILIGNLIA